MSKKKDVEYYMSLPYHINVIPEEEFEGYIIMFPDLPGCLTSGSTLEEAIANIDDAKRCWFAAAIESGYKIKEPEEHSYTGQLRMRMPKSLHRDLALRAQEEGVSMNQFCVYALQKTIYEN